jgi:hypothetical protein
MDGLFWIDPYPDEPLGPGAYSSPDDQWTVYGDDMTFRWEGGRSIYIYDQCRNFRLFEIWTFSNTIPTSRRSATSDPATNSAASGMDECASQGLHGR